MTIIKHGEKPEPKVLRFACSNCGCVFEASSDECFIAVIYRTFGSGETIIYGADCPECGKQEEAIAQ